MSEGPQVSKVTHCVPILSDLVNFRSDPLTKVRYRAARAAKKSPKCVDITHLPLNDPSIRQRYRDDADRDTSTTRPPEQGCCKQGWKKANLDVMFSGESRRHFVPQTPETVSSLPLTRPVSPHPEAWKAGIKSDPNSHRFIRAYFFSKKCFLQPNP